MSKNIIVLSPEQESFLLDLGYLDLIEIYPCFEDNCESFCEDNDLVFPVFTVKKSNEYWKFLENMVNPSSKDYQEAFHQEIISKILSRDRYKTKLISLFNDEIEVA